MITELVQERLARPDEGHACPADCCRYPA